MLCLINKQAIMTEAMELARMKIAHVLCLPIETVHAQWEKNALGEVFPNFAVEFPDTQDVTNRQVRDVIESVYKSFKGELRDRLHGLHSQRPEKEKTLFAREVMKK